MNEDSAFLLLVALSEIFNQGKEGVDYAKSIITGTDDEKYASIYAERDEQ